MSPKTRTFLSENNIYVSWGILIFVVTITWMVAQTMGKVDALAEVVPEVRNLNDRTTKLESAMAWVTEMYNRDIQTPKN